MSTIFQSLAGKRLLGIAALLTGLSLTGCQVDVGGQTLPSPNYLQDDVQYFAPGPQMKVAREAAAQKAYREEQALRAGQPPQAQLP